jgi:hypothetical protein
LVLASVATIAVILLVLVGVTGLLVRYILQRPLNQLIMGIEQTAKGDYDYRFRPAHQIEIATIIEKFQDMSSQIQIREKSLKHMNDQLGHEIRERQEVEEKVRKLNEELEARVVERTRVGIASREFYFGLRVGERYVDPAPYLGRLVGRPRLIPMDATLARRAPEPRLVCSVVPVPARR